MRLLQRLGLAALCLVLAHAAAAQRPMTRSGVTRSGGLSRPGTPEAITGYSRGAVHTRAVSGTTGAHSETLLAPGNGWIYGLEIGEKADQPCYLGLWAVEGTAPAPGFPVAFDHCDGEVNDNSVASLGFDYGRSQQIWQSARQMLTTHLIGIPIYQEIRTTGILFSHALDHSDPRPPLPALDGKPVALDGVGICQRNANDEMKGLRIHGSTLGLSGPHIVPEPIVTTSPRVVAGITIPAGSRVNEEFKRPNCSNSSGGWKPIRTCASGEVLVGLVVHYKFPTVGNRQRARITGLAPKCARITIQRG